MELIKISENKKQFLDLLLQADEQEDMIDKHLDIGELFAFYDGDLKGVCVVAKLEASVYEIKNIAICEEYRRLGYGKKLIQYIFDYYKDRCSAMYVGTGESPQIISFYEGCGFSYSHRIEKFFTDNYEHPMFDDGIQLIDMIYLKKDFPLETAEQEGGIK